MPPSTTMLSNIFSFAVSEAAPFVVPSLVALLLGLFIGRVWTQSTEGLRADALEISYSQALQDSYIIRRVVESTSDGLVVQDLLGKVIWVNPAYCQMFLRTPEEMIGRNPLEFVCPDDHQITAKEIEDFRYNPADPSESGLHLWRNKRANGEEFWNQISVSFRTAPDGTEHAILSCRDVTEQVNRERELENIRTKLEFRAAHDDLTGIANRAALMKFTTQALEVAAETGRKIGMIRVDLDHFKDINDTHGHPAGDAVLIHVAKVFHDKLRNTDLIARIGGDEYVAVCPDIGNLDDLEKIATSLGRACARPFRWENGTLKCSASFGVALSRPNSTSAEELLQHSDFALYETKRRGRGGVTTYSQDLHQTHFQQAQRRDAFAQALRDDGLSFYFQPVVNLLTREVGGFETLVRWETPDAGTLSPKMILPLAEELGLMAELDIAAMRAGLRLKARLQAEGHASIRIALNASPEGLKDPAYFATLRALTDDHGIAPGEVAIEVLETVMFDNSPNARDHSKSIAQLHRHGFQTLLDDFGIGHAGLSHLAQLELTGVKMDRSLAANVLHDRVSHRIVRTIVELCNDLDLRLIAEGVEDAEVAACLRDIGVPILQGFWISTPLPEDQVIPWLRSYKLPPLPLDIPSKTPPARVALGNIAP